MPANLQKYAETNSRRSKWKVFYVLE